MSQSSDKSRKRLLDPMERTFEILFGLIMVLTFTCSFSVAEAGRARTSVICFSPLSAVIWLGGMIDAVFYLMGCLSEQGHNIITLRAVRKTADPAEAHRLIADALPPRLASVLPETEFEVMRQKLAQLPEPPAHPGSPKTIGGPLPVSFCWFSCPP